MVAEILASWAPSSSSTGVGGTLGSTLAATRWVVPVPDVDAETTVTVFNPGPEPVTAELLPADLVDRRVGATSEPELADPAGSGQDRAAGVLGARPVRWWSPPTTPWSSGLTVLGDAGAGVEHRPS